MDNITLKFSNPQKQNTKNIPPRSRWIRSKKTKTYYWRLRMCSIRRETYRKKWVRILKSLWKHKSIVAMMLLLHRSKSSTFLRILLSKRLEKIIAIISRVVPYHFAKPAICSRKNISTPHFKIVFNNFGSFYIWIMYRKKRIRKLAKCWSFWKKRLSNSVTKDHQNTESDADLFEYLHDAVAGLEWAKQR